MDFARTSPALASCRETRRTELVRGLARVIAISLARSRETSRLSSSRRSLPSSPKSLGELVRARESCWGLTNVLPLDAAPAALYESVHIMHKENPGGVKRATKREADVESVHPKTRESALMLAGRRGNFKMVDILLKENASVSTRSVERYSAGPHLRRR